MPFCFTRARYCAHAQKHLPLFTACASVRATWVRLYAEDRARKEGMEFTLAEAESIDLAKKAVAEMLTVSGGLTSEAHNRSS